MSTDAVTQKVAALSLEPTSPPSRAALPPGPTTPVTPPPPQQQQQQQTPPPVLVKQEPAPTPLLSQLPPQQQTQQTPQPPQDTGVKRGTPAPQAAAPVAAASVPISVPSKMACSVARSTPTAAAAPAVALKRTARTPPDALAFAAAVPVPGGAGGAGSAGHALSGSAPATRAVAKWADVPLSGSARGAGAGAVGAGAGKSGGEDGVAPFVSKTYDLVNDPTTQHLVGWSAEHKCLAFVVYDPVEFAASVLPRYFKHSNFCSFVRQLNIYGFHKIESSEGFCFQHPNFRINSPHLLRNIQRRKSSHRKGAQADLGASTSPTGAGHPSPTSPTAAAAAAAAAASLAPPSRHAAAQSPTQAQISPVVQIAMSTAFAQQQQQQQQKQHAHSGKDGRAVSPSRAGVHADALPWACGAAPVGSPPLGGPLGAFETKQSPSSSSSSSTPPTADELLAQSAAVHAVPGPVDVGCSPETATILQNLRASLPRNTEPAEVYKVLLDEIIKLQRQNGDTQNTIKHLRDVLMQSKTREQQLQQRLQSISQYIHECNVANPATPIPHDLVLLSQPPQLFQSSPQAHYPLSAHPQQPPQPQQPQQPQPQPQQQPQQQQLHASGPAHLGSAPQELLGFGEVLPVLDPIVIKHEPVDPLHAAPGADSAAPGDPPPWAQTFPADLMHPDDDGSTSLFVPPDPQPFADAHYVGADPVRSGAGGVGSSSSSSTGAGSSTGGVPADLALGAPDQGPVLLGPAALQQWGIADPDDYWSAVSMR